MILIDSNLLIYAHVETLPQHEAARDWLDGCLSDSHPVGLPWPSLLGFVRIVSNPRVFQRPETVTEAWACVVDWLSQPQVWIPEPTDRHVKIIGTFLNTVVTQSNLVPDAHLAALAIEHGLTLCSTDGDFGRFPGLRWENPIAPRPQGKI